MPYIDPRSAVQGLPTDNISWLDFFGPTQPMSTPFGISAPTATSLQNLYQIPGVPYASQSSIPFGAGAGTTPAALESLYQAAGPTGFTMPATAGVGTSASDLASLYGSGAASGASGLSRFVNLPTAFKWGGVAETPFLSSFLGRGAVGLGISVGGNMLADQLGGQQSGLGRFVSGASTLGGLAAPLGPEVAIPAAVVGGAYNAIFGGSNEPSKDELKQKLADSADKLGVDSRYYPAIFDLLVNSGAKPKEAAATLAQQLISDSVQQRAEAKAQAQAVEQRQMDQRFALALQAQAQEFFGPYTNNIITAGQSQADLLKGLAQQLPAPYRGVMENQAEQALSQSQRLAGAYAAQTAILPNQFMAQQELKREQQLQQLQYQLAVIQAQQSKGGGGGLDQLINPQNQQGQGQQLLPTG